MNRTPSIALLTALLLTAGHAHAQTAKPADPPALSGPTVKDNALPGSRDSLGDKPSALGKKGGHMDDRGLPMPAFMEAMAVIRSDAAGEHKLTAEQQEKIRAINTEFQEKTREYLQANRAELQKLREEAKNKGIELRPQPSEAKPAEGATLPKPDPDAQKLRDRAQALMEGRPSPKDVQTKIWGVLTEGQKKLVQPELDKAKEKLADQMGKRAAEAKAKKEAKKLGGKADLKPELREKLKNMTPEQRKEFLENQRKKAGKGKNVEGTDKPAPSPEQVNVPAPQ